MEMTEKTYWTYMQILTELIDQTDWLIDWSIWLSDWTDWLS